MIRLFIHKWFPISLSFINNFQLSIWLINRRLTIITTLVQSVTGSNGKKEVVLPTPPSSRLEHQWSVKEVRDDITCFKEKAKLLIIWKMGKHLTFIVPWRNFSSSSNLIGIVHIMYVSFWEEEIPPSELFKVSNIVIIIRKFLYC